MGRLRRPSSPLGMSRRSGAGADGTGGSYRGTLAKMVKIKGLIARRVSIYDRPVLIPPS